MQPQYQHKVLITTLHISESHTWWSAQQVENIYQTERKCQIHIMHPIYLYNAYVAVNLGVIQFPLLDIKTWESIRSHTTTIVTLDQIFPPGSTTKHSHSTTDLLIYVSYRHQKISKQVSSQILVSYIDITERTQKNCLKKR